MNEISHNTLNKCSLLVQNSAYYHIFHHSIAFQNYVIEPIEPCMVPAGKIIDFHSSFQ